MLVLHYVLASDMIRHILYTVNIHWRGGVLPPCPDAVNSYILSSSASARLGSLSMYDAVRSKNVQRSPCVVTLRNALTPRPWYTRASPRRMGFGLSGSGPIQRRRGIVNTRRRLYVRAGLEEKTDLERVGNRSRRCRVCARPQVRAVVPLSSPWKRALSIKRS